MMQTRRNNLSPYLALSVLLHIGVLLFLFYWLFRSPYQPPEITFEDIEVIDTETFEALLSEAQAGNSGQDETDAPSQAQTVNAAEQAPQEDALPTDEVNTAVVEDRPQDAGTASPPPPTPPAPTAEPEDLPPPVVIPDELPDPQPLPEVDQASRSGLADPESQGRENANEVTFLPVPPARQATELQDVAVEAVPESTQTPQDEVVTEQSDEAEIALEEETASEQDATNAVTPEASPDAPLSAAAEVSTLPVARPSDLQVPQETAADSLRAQTESGQGTSADEGEGQDEQVASDQATQSTPSEEPAATPFETASDGEVDAQTEGNTDDPTIDDLLEQALSETEEGTRSGGRGLSSFEQQSILQTIYGNWNSGILRDKRNYEQLVVTLRFKTNASGNLEGPIRLIHPQIPNRDEQIAYESARRAVLSSLPLQMPNDINPEGVLWTIIFDPASEQLR